MKNHKQSVGALNEISSGEVLSDDEIAVLEEINRTFTHVTIGGKHKVVSLKPSQTAVYRTFSRIYHNFSIIFIINRESPESWRDRRGCHGVGRTTSQEA